MEFFIWILLCTLVAAWAKKKGRSPIGAFLVSLVLSPFFGAIIVFSLEPSKEKSMPFDEYGDKPTPETHIACPDCRSLIRRESCKCKNCGAGLIPQ